MQLRAPDFFSKETIMFVQSGQVWVMFGLLLVTATCGILETSRACSSPVDMIFMFDSSVNVDLRNYAKALNFASEVAQQFQIGACCVRFGAVVFGDEPVKLFDLKDYSSHVPLTLKLLAAPHLGGVARTHVAVSYVDRSHMFSEAAGGRTSAQDVLVVFTDGNSRGLLRTLTAAAALKQKKTVIITVGLTDQFSRTVLHGLATSSDDVFMVSQPGVVEVFKQRLASHVCPESGSARTLGDLLSALSVPEQLSAGTLGEHMRTLDERSFVETLDKHMRTLNEHIGTLDEQASAGTLDEPASLAISESDSESDEHEENTRLEDKSSSSEAEDEAGALSKFSSVSDDLPEKEAGALSTSSSVSDDLPEKEAGALSTSSSVSDDLPEKEAGALSTSSSVSDDLPEKEAGALSTSSSVSDDLPEKEAGALSTFSSVSDDLPEKEAGALSTSSSVSDDLPEKEAGTLSTPFPSLSDDLSEKEEKEDDAESLSPGLFPAGCVVDTNRACSGRPNGDYPFCYPHCVKGGFVTCSNGITYVRDCGLGWYQSRFGARTQEKLVYDPVLKSCQQETRFCPRRLDTLGPAYNFNK